MSQATDRLDLWPTWRELGWRQANLQICDAAVCWLLSPRHLLPPAAAPLLPLLLQLTIVMPISLASAAAQPSSTAAATSRQWAPTVATRPSAAAM